MTLTRFMIDVSRKDPSLQDLESLMSSIQMGCKTIASLVQRAGIKLCAAQGKVDAKARPRLEESYRLGTLWKPRGNTVETWMETPGTREEKIGRNICNY
mgnify:CR=1 FL=1